MNDDFNNLHELSELDAKIAAEDPNYINELQQQKKATHQKKSNVIQMYELKSINASSIEPQIQPWLWNGYIPLETCTLIAGKGGIGKSQFLMWLAS